MAIWMEMRCDLNFGDDCWDTHNRMVKLGGFNRAEVVSRARKLGWRVLRSGLASCPACTAKDQPHV